MWWLAQCVRTIDAVNARECSLRAVTCQMQRGKRLSLLDLDRVKHLGHGSVYSKYLPNRINVCTFV
jgi:hypothetical protein